MAVEQNPGIPENIDKEKESGDTSRSTSPSYGGEPSKNTIWKKLIFLDRWFSFTSMEASCLTEAQKKSVKILTPEDIENDESVKHRLGFYWPQWQKWLIITVVFIVQCSMNLNAGIYGNAVSGLREEYQIGAQKARVGQMIFLILYAIGCELWAPWSEDKGRKVVLQTSLFFVNIWCLLPALSTNYATVVVGRALGGLSSAGGSVTLGIVADMWDPNRQGFAVAYVVFSSVGGSVLGPLVGCFIEAELSWRWIFWIQLIFGGFTQILHMLVPETNPDSITTMIARERRRSGETNVFSQAELRTMEVKEILKTWWRPFEMFIFEPIVLSLSLLSGFSDALIFTFIDSYSLVYGRQWGFGTIPLGLSFLPLLVGYFIAWFIYLPELNRLRKKLVRAESGGPPVRAEERLWLLLFLAPLETIGLFIFAWTSTGPPIPWIVPMIFSAFVGIANYAIYMATIDYMIAAYGIYSSSATGGNGFARDFLAGIAAMYATPLYSNVGDIPSRQLSYGSTILACLAFVVIIPIYVFYIYGETIRDKSRIFKREEEKRRKHAERAALSGVVSNRDA